MTNYVIQKTDKPKRGAFVSRPGYRYSYTRSLRFVRTYETREAAQKDCCGNERVLHITEVMK